VFHLHRKDKAKKLIVARAMEVANAVHYEREHEVLVLFLLNIYVHCLCALILILSHRFVAKCSVLLRSQSLLTLRT